MALVKVTPENAALWGFDRIGQTINTDTGGIVNPFEGPADGFNRDARNTVVQQRATATPNYVAPGYSQIMSDPRNRAFNERLLNDPQFAWSNLQEGFGNQVDGNNPMLFYNGAGTSSPTNPIASRRVPPTGQTNTSTNPIGSSRTGGTTPPSTPPGTGTNPIGSERQTTTTAPPVGNNVSQPGTGPDSGQGLFGIGNQNTYDPSKTGSAFQSAAVPGVQKAKAEYNPRDGVVNAMTKQFKAKSWF